MARWTSAVRSDLTVVLVLVLATPRLASAYDCPEPKPRTFRSEDGRVRLDVTADGHATLRVGKKVAFRRELGTEVDQVLFIEDRIVIIDDHDPSIAVYDLVGTRLASYELEQLFTCTQIRRTGAKCGSWWTDDLTFRVDAAKHELVLKAQQRRTFRIDVETGALRPVRRPRRACPDWVDPRLG